MCGSILTENYMIWVYTIYIRVCTGRLAFQHEMNHFSHHSGLRGLFATKLILAIFLMLLLLTLWMQNHSHIWVKFALKQQGCDSLNN